MKHALLLPMLLLLAPVSIAQQRSVNYEMALNPAQVGISYTATPTTAVNLTYDLYQSGIAAFIGGRIVSSFADLQDDATRRLASVLRLNGSSQDRYRTAAEVVRQLLAGNKRIIVNGADLSYALDKQVAQDLLLYQQIKNGGISYLIQNSPDAQIPFRAVTNYPLSIVKGERAPIVVDNSKFIRIK
jgi:hypothetical protein